MFDIQSETVRHLFRTKFGVQVFDRQDEVIETNLSKAAEEHTKHQEVAA